MNYRIGEGKKWLMLIIAVIIDVIEVFTSATIVVAVISGVIQYGIMWGMFATSGVKFFGGAKRLRRQITGGILESIPGIEMLPIYTWNVWTTIEESRREDEAKYESEGNPNPNTIRTKTGDVQNPNLPKPPNTLREARNKVS